MNHPQPVRQRLRGLGATGLLLVLVVGTPVALIGIGAAPWAADLGETQTLLTSPDDGTLALVVIAAVAWIAWAVMAASVTVEILAQLRGLSAPSLPGLALPQRAASRLVATAALLFIAAPIALSGFPAAPMNAAVAAPVLAAPRLEVVAAAAPVPQIVTPVPTTSTATPQSGQTTIDYTVKRGDSLWKIAERLLGDGARYTDLVALNHDVLGGRPDFIVSGTVLRVPREDGPSDEDGRTSERYVVRTGDTLSEIADAKLGDPLRYPEVAAASRSTVQPDGAHLVDLDLIQPGWKLTIPRTAPPEHHPVEPSVIVEPPRVVDPPELPDVPPVEQPPTTPQPEPAVEPAITPPAVATAANDAEGVEVEQSPGWLMPGLTGSGAVLAAGILLAVRAHRRTQLRYRRPGQRVAPPPPELARVEKTAFVSGAPHLDELGQLDRALRHLAAQVEAEGQALPALTSVTLARGTVTLHLAEATDLSLPWEGADCEWSTALNDSIPDVDQIAPYPLLVSVGQDDADRLHLLNLEHLRALTISGDPVAALALARHITAELALNPWSILVDVDAVGVGEELAQLDGMRLNHHGLEVHAVEPILADLRRAEQGGFGDPESFHVVVTTSLDDATQLIEILQPATSRLGAAVVCVHTAPVPGSVSAEVDKGGRLRLPALGLDLKAAGLTGEEATACAAIVDLTRASQAVPMPAFTLAADGWQTLADQAGALRGELTEVRGPGTVSHGSLLPNPVNEYIALAATVTADVETLAPVITQQVCEAVLDADPMLDDDVAAWFSEDCPLPRLALLGPVTASTHGTLVPAIAKRKPYFVELLAYLALHPQGKAGNAVAEDFSIASSRARTDLGHLRDWLGTNPRTDRLHLPLATASRTYEETGVKTYQVEDVLIDLDIFRRLRARGQARGSAGIGDLTTALRLVEGMPFDHLRERGWSWLLDGDRLHESVGASIVDTAHIVVLDALSKSDLTTARSVAEFACRAAPYDDICRLDLIKVAATEGYDDAVDRMLTDDVFNRTDDHLPPVDLPERTSEVVDEQGWG